MSDEASRATRQLPLIIGGVCVAVGVIAGLWPGSTGSDGGAPTATPTTSAPATATVSPSASPSAEVVVSPAPAYVEPDLGGPDVGEVVVASAVEAAGLAVLGQDLWWLSTEGATLARSRLDGGDPTIVYTPEDAGAVGGSLAVGQNHVFFSVPTAGTVYRVGLGPSAKAEVFASGSSPELLATVKDDVYWVDGDGLWRSPGGESKPKRITTLAGVVTSFASRRDGVVWLEAPLAAAKGQPALMRHDGEGTRRLGALDLAERDSLVASGEHLFWAETRGPDDAARGHLVGLERGGAPRPLRVSGLISHVAVDGERLLWTEIYVEKSISLLFSASMDGKQVKRVGRIPGFVTSLTVHQGVVYWSGSRGIERLRLGAK